MGNCVSGGVGELPVPLQEFIEVVSPGDIVWVEEKPSKLSQNRNHYLVKSTYWRSFQTSALVVNGSAGVPAVLLPKSSGKAQLINAMTLKDSAQKMAMTQLQPKLNEAELQLLRQFAEESASSSPAQEKRVTLLMTWGNKLFCSQLVAEALVAVGRARLVSPSIYGPDKKGRGLNLGPLVEARMPRPLAAKSSGAKPPQPPAAVSDAKVQLTTASRKSVQPAAAPKEIVLRTGRRSAPLIARRSIPSSPVAVAATTPAAVAAPATGSDRPVLSTLPREDSGMPSQHTEAATRPPKRTHAELAAAVPIPMAMDKPVPPAAGGTPEASFTTAVAAMTTFNSAVEASSESTSQQQEEQQQVEQQQMASSELQQEQKAAFGWLWSSRSGRAGEQLQPRFSCPGPQLMPAMSWIWPHAIDFGRTSIRTGNEGTSISSPGTASQGIAEAVMPQEAAQQLDGTPAMTFGGITLQQQQHIVLPSLDAASMPEVQLQKGAVGKDVFEAIGGHDCRSISQPPSSAASDDSSSVGMDTGSSEHQQHPQQESGDVATLMQEQLKEAVAEEQQEHHLQRHDQQQQQQRSFLGRRCLTMWAGWRPSVCSVDG